MAEPVVVEQSRSISVSVEDAFQGTLMMDVPAVFHRRYGPFPPIRQVINEANTWGTVGQTRTLKMAGGGSTLEELTKVNAPHYFAYHVGNIKGPLSLAASGIDGEFEFTPEDAGTKATWRWTVYPRSALTRPVVGMLGKAWHGWARQSLEELANQLVR
ncbi:SRPBCC family protein [Mycobacterium sp. MMS18-G62]